jgi:hypothetical protein
MPGVPPQPKVSALPSRKARALAFIAILVAGVASALIGWSFADIQCDGDCNTAQGIGALIGGSVGAGGVAVVAVLGLRAMGEWGAIQERAGEESAGGGEPPNTSRRNPSA